MSDEALTTLLNMGFGYEESMSALETCKQDVSEAVTFLTDPTRTVVPFGPQPENKDAQPMDVETFEIPEEFPSQALKEIKGRIYSENWAMNYREGEVLLTCIEAANTLTDKQSVDSDEDCKKFVFEIMPVMFTKLLTNTHVVDSELQEAIYNITSTYLTLAVTQLRFSLDEGTLKILTIIMDPRSEFNFKNRSKRPKHSSNSETVYAQCPARTTFRDPYGWMVCLVNKFGAEGGFTAILDRIDDDVTPFTLSHVLKPWGKCVEYLLPDTVGPIFKDIMTRSIDAIRRMTVGDYKSKEIGLVCDLLVSMKNICTGCGNQFTMQDARGMDEMRLQEIEKMLKTSHFNARMNALNETLRVVEETRDMNLKYPIDSDRVLEWLTTSRILMIALENNLHQTQYTAKLMKIADFMGCSVTQEDVSQFWKLQEGRQPVVVDNAHNIIAAAATHFNEMQANHLFSLITESWIRQDSKGRQRLLTLLGKLGKLALALEQVWAMIHLKDVGIEEIEQGLALHLDLLNSPIHQDERKKEYVMKCIADIKSRDWVVPAMKYLVRILNNCFQSSSKLGKNILKELQNSVVAVKLITTSLVANYTSITDKYNDRIHADTMCTDSCYTLTECVHTHLKMLKLVLEQSSDYLHWNYVEDIWDCLTSQKAATAHYDECCDWFARAVSDLDPNTQTKLFEQRLMLLQPASVRMYAFNCFKVYFESINTREGKMKRWSSDNFTVESLKMTGVQFIWTVSLEARDEYVSRDAMAYLLRVNYSALSPKLKRDCSTLHMNFTRHCQQLLQECVEQNSNTDVGQEKLTRIANILNITTDYILLAESTHRGIRLMEPHGATYLGSLMTFSIELDKDSSFTVYHHSNEKLSAVRLHAAKLTNSAPESVEVRVADEVLPISQDTKILHLSSITEGCVVKIKLLPTASSPVKSWSEEFNTPVRNEKQLPGVLLTTQPRVHRNLQVLATMGPRVSSAVQRLLNQLPTDPTIQETLETLESGSVKAVESILSDLLSGPVTKITYNLEAISARIMPVERDSSDREALNTIFVNLTTDIPGAGRESRCGLDVFYDIFHGESSSQDPRSRRPSNMTLSELFLGETREEFVGVSLLVVAIFRGLLCGISSPLFKHSVSLNTTFLRRLSRPQLLTMMKFFTHTALCASFSNKLKSWGLALPAQTCSTINRIPEGHSTLGCEAFEMVMMGASHHPDGIPVLFEILEIPGYKRTLLEMLLYTPSNEVRSLVAGELEKLCCSIGQEEMGAEVEEMGHEKETVPNVKFKLLQILLKTPLPIWGPSVHVRDSQQRLLARCTQFFSLASFLLRDLSLESPVCRRLSIADLVRDEMKLLKTAAAEGSVSQAFLAGHIRLLCSLASIKGVDKRHMGNKLIRTLLADFLFPAANLMYKSSASKTRSRGFSDGPVTASSEDVQSAAFSLLVTLVTDSPENSRDVTVELVRLHHQPNQDLVTEWSYLPLVQPRAECGFVGLKNGGATCYMNAVLQQLHAIPGLSEQILSVQPSSPASPTRSQPQQDETMFLQFQHLLGYLSESQHKFYTPQGFWKSFKLWGQPINLHEQQDAFELFNNLTDQVDEVLKSRGDQQVYQRQFGGQFVDQKICVECPHRSEMVEPFMSISVSTRSGNLEESLEQFVKGEVLEGDNAYLCEPCHEKRTTLKRTCIKTLPSTLIIHLKRFDYDWERNKAFKFDDYFSFPAQLDMLPFTQIGVEGTDKQKRDVASLYTLTGVIVHSGQANAGHYYSFIKNRGTNEWFKFNDDTVTSIKMSDQTMVEECFGGEFKSKGSTRNRYWNAYILLYDRIEEMCPPSPWKKPQKPISPTKRLKPSRLSLTKLSDIPDNGAPTSRSESDRDPVNALEELIRTGEKSGMFHEKLPHTVRNSIIESNTKLLKERAVFNASYFDFVRKLVITNIACAGGEYAHWSVTLMCNFYLHTYLHVSPSFHFHEDAWLETFRIALESRLGATQTFLKFISSTRNHDYLTLHLLTCPKLNIRKKFSELLKIAFNSLQKFEALQSEIGESFLTRYLAIISRDLPENNKNCEQYLGILYHYSKLSPAATKQLRRLNYVSLFTKFLLSNNGGDWSSNQIKNFLPGYNTLGQILSHTDLSDYHTSSTNTPNPLLSVHADSPSSDNQGNQSNQGIHSILTDQSVCKSLVSHLLLVSNSAVHSSLCHLAWCNQQVSTCLVTQLTARLASVQAHELVRLFALLLHVLDMEDPYQISRVEGVICGEHGQHGSLGETGLLSLVKRSSGEDPKRAYQCVKFLTQLLRSNPAAKAHILTHVTDWEWSVNWLRSAYETEAKSSTVSNESASTKGFQRTTSAQETLTDATALLNEFESSQ